MKHMLSRFILPFSIIVLIIFTYQNLPKTFFQQDEWQYFGSTIYALSSAHPVVNVVLPLQGQVTHFFPLATLFFLLEYIFFKTNFPPYALINIFFHTINALLLYLLVVKLTQRKILAWGASLLFAVNSIAHQPVSWVAAGIGTLPSTMFLLIFFITLLRWKQKNQATMIIGFLSLLAAILFKETALFIFVFLPIVWIVMRPVFRNKFTASKGAVIGFITVGFFYALLRVFFLVSSVRSAQPEIGDVSAAPPATYVYRLITVSLKTLPQTIIPFRFLRATADGVVHLAYPHFVATDGVANPYLVESIVFDLICYIGSALLLLLAFFCYRLLRRREPQLARLLILSILFIITGALPFMFIPGRASYFSIFEPRNLYVISIGSSLFIVLSIYAIASIIFSKSSARLITTLLIGFLAFFHAFSIRGDIDRLEAIGTVRKNLLTTVELSYPKLTPSVIVYTESDRSYYGLSEEDKILPVQSGFGRMLMVWYQDKEKFPGCLYEQQFLHDLTSEGYKTCDGRGFGYARNYATLLQLMQQNRLRPEEAIAFSWNGTKEEFSDITALIRGKVARDTNQPL